MRRPFALLCSFAFVLLAPAPARAQVNTDALRPGPVRAGLGGGLDTSLSMLSGNVNLLDLSLGGRVQALSLFPPRAEDDPTVPPYVKDMALLMGNARYTSKEGKSLLNQGLLHVRYMHAWHRRVGSVVFAQHQFNEFQRLKVRSLWGSSVSFQVVHERRVNITFGSGYMLELNHIAVEPGAPDVEETLEHRWSNFLGAQVTLFDGRLLGQSSTYFQPRFDELADIRFLEEAEALAKVSDVLSFGGVVSVLLDTRPPTGVKSLDTRIATTVKVTF